MKFNEMIREIKDTLNPSSVKGEHVQTGPEASASREALADRLVVVPTLDAYENEDEWVLQADVPGARPDNTNVWYDQREGLSVHVKPQLEVAEEHKLIAGEFAEVDWYCAIPLPEYLDGAQATSSVARGVLTVHVPKKQAAKPRAVPIEFKG
jgi:HSP20 family molecular chaperone IbpA